MPIQPGERLRKVTLNLFDADVEDLGHLYGHGWSEAVRLLVRKHLQEKKKEPYVKGMTIGDYVDAQETQG